MYFRFMNIISYNVNGIRAALKKGFLEWLMTVDPELVCLQETKAQKEQLDLSVFEDAGYTYQYWFSAQKKGYSGVAILSKQKPLHVAYGTGIDYMDVEGRNLRVDFDDFSVMNLYLPSGTNRERLSFKFRYMNDFLEYVKTLKKKYSNLIICGDYNICHKAIDIHDPIRNAKVSGFLPQERAWFDKLIKAGFVDSFRDLNNDPHHYTWWSYRANARNNNKGWRIDYALVTQELASQISRAYILPTANHSDHCPVGIKMI